MSEHHHKETFVTKYIFSQDHKMISKQFLVTGMFMGIIAVLMSMLFRLQLAWPDTSFTIVEAFLGSHQTNGIMDPDIYLALVTIHGTIMVFFVLTAGLSGTFSNLLIPLQIGARDMASGFLNMIPPAGATTDPQGKVFNTGVSAGRGQYIYIYIYIYYYI